MRLCPRCEIPYMQHPAISRKDNETEICPNCGMAEAIEDMFKEAPRYEGPKYWKDKEGKDG